MLLLSFYILIGPLPWFAMLVLMYYGRRRMRRLLEESKRPADPNAPTPRVTVLVPAKDEGPAVRECVARIVAMGYPNFDVIAIDDRSTDDTGVILDDLARSIPGDKLRVLHVPRGSLPDGWFGKPHALHLGSQHLRPETAWLLFVDSDVLVAPDALRQALSVSIRREYDALSITTSLRCESFVERLVMPLAAGLWITVYAVSFTNEDNRPDHAYANGQFFLIRREAYEKVGGHASVPATVVEDVELMKLLKSAGYKTRFQIGRGHASTRMYRGWEQIRNGWSRTFCGTSRRRPARLIVAIVWLLVFGLSLYPALAWTTAQWFRGDEHRIAWLIASAAHAIFMTSFLARFYAASGNRARYALLFPVSVGFLVAILVRAVKLCRTGQISWRGSTVSLLPARAGSER